MEYLPKLKFVLKSLSQYPNLQRAQQDLKIHIFINALKAIEV